jgi:hypothetical protein
VAAVSLVVAAQLVGAPAASATRGLITGVAEPTFSSAANPDELFDLTARANAELVRIGVRWRSVAPRRPANPRDPADAAYDFSGVDAAVRAAQARGFQVLLTASLAPNWAEGPNRPDLDTAPPGTWDPDPVAFGDFAHAVAKRYSGDFVDPARSELGPLPWVRHFEVWNEPNLATFLGPQWVGSEPRSPILYRELLNSFYDGVKAVRVDNLVVGGSLAPYGDEPGRTRTRPLFFLRELFCLEGRRKLTPRQCPAARADVFSAHPINISGGPRRSAINPDDASSGDIGEVRRVLRAAETGGNVQPAGRRPLWATEFWFWRLPGSDGKLAKVPPRRMARYIEEALYLLWRNRVEVAVYYRLRDTLITEPPLGLFSFDSTPKPALQAFRFPFVTERRSRKSVRAWGKSPNAGRLSIERRKGGKWRRIKRVNVGEGEVFTTRLRLRDAAILRARVAGEHSLTWRQRG